MKLLSNKELRTFEHIVGMSQHSLKASMSQIIRTRYSNVIETQDYLVAEGEIPIAVVAHLDTVFLTQPSEIFYDTHKNVLWAPEGLGADDRAGVFAILQLLKAQLKPHIILCCDEERGCLGSSELAKIKMPFADCRYIIQLDRRNGNDCVFYDCENTDFIKYVESFGFTEAWGTFSDISEICPAWGVAGVNLSVGYVNEHTTGELLYVNHLHSTINKVKKMLTEKEIPSFEYIEKVYDWSKYYGSYGKYGWNHTKGKGKYSAYNYDYGVECFKCHDCFWDDEVFPVKLRNGKTGYVCMECVPGNVDWCARCGECFELAKEQLSVSMAYCPDCEGMEDDGIDSRDTKAI